MVGVFLLSGCVNKKPLPWPPVDETQEMPVYLYGPIYEVSSAPKTGKHFALLKKVILEIVEHPEKYLPQEYLERISGIGYEHYFDTLVQSDEWSTIKGMASASKPRNRPDPERVAAVLDTRSGRLTGRYELALRLTSQFGILWLEGYRYAVNPELELGKANWFAWSLSGEETDEKKLHDAVRLLLLEKSKLGQHPPKEAYAYYQCLHQTVKNKYQWDKLIHYYGVVEKTESETCKTLFSVLKKDGKLENYAAYVNDHTAPSKLSLVIDDGEKQTRLSKVSLEIKAVDRVGVTGIFVSENSAKLDLSANGWQEVNSQKNYSAKIPFYFTSGKGEKTVYLWFRDFMGNLSAPISSSIIRSVYLSDSGQSGDYTNIFGEDSDYKINPPAYTINGDGSVMDQNTKLFWQQKDDAKKRNWQEAKNYCSNLNLAGKNDWRLPEIQDLQTIVDLSKTRPALDSAVFLQAKSQFYWSSTSNANNSSDAWYIGFQKGFVHSREKSNSYFVRCVRIETQTGEK